MYESEIYDDGLTEDAHEFMGLENSERRQFRLLPAFCLAAV